MQPDLFKLQPNLKFEERFGQISAYHDITNAAMRIMHVGSERFFGESSGSLKKEGVYD